MLGDMLIGRVGRVFPRYRQRREGARRAVRGLVGWLALCGFSGGGAAAGGPTIADILRQHENLSAELVSGRLAYTTTHESSDATLQEMQARYEGSSASFREAIEQSDLSEKDKEVNSTLAGALGDPSQGFAMVEFLRANGRYEETLLFDRQVGASVWTKRDPRDLQTLGIEHGLGGHAMLNFPSFETALAHGHDLLEYRLPSNMALLWSFPTDRPVPAMLVMERGDEFGLLSRRTLGRGEWSIAEREDGMLRAERTDGDRSEVLVLDPALAFRWREREYWRAGVRRTAVSIRYRLWGDDIFPETFEQVDYGSEGEPRARLTREYTSVELNVPVDSAEFELELPEDAGVTDGDTRKELKALGSLDPPLYGAFTPEDLREVLLNYQVGAGADPPGWPVMP